MSEPLLSQEGKATIDVVLHSWSYMNSLVTIEEYDKSFQAQVAVLALEQAGIQCFLENETIVAMDWFMANAVGGIRLQVAQADAIRARDILLDIRKQREDREYAHQDKWVTFRCSACKELVAFSGPSLGRVETCMKCGKYIDVPLESDSSLTEAQIAATVASATQSSFLYSGGLKSRTYLILEILLVLWAAYFSDLHFAVSAYLEYIHHGDAGNFETAFGAWADSSPWLWRRSLFVFAVMFPVLFLNGFSADKKPKEGVNWSSLAGAGVLLGLGSFVISWAMWRWSWGALAGEVATTPMETTNELVGLILAMTLVVIANSFAEELVMRAYLIDRLERLTGNSVLAVIVSALMFGSYHIYQGLLLGLLGATLIGLIFGVYYARYRRLSPLIMAHTIHNLLCIFLY